MARAKSAKPAAKGAKAGKPEGWSAKMRAHGATNCKVCGRLMVDMPQHTKDHASGKVGKDGKRTKRPAKEVLAWRNRYNGKPATKRFEGLDEEQRAKAKPLVKA
jgi:hypothetical protein